MYGTVARLEVLPGHEEQLLALQAEWGRDRVEQTGIAASYIFRADANGNEYWVVAVFQDKEAYWANARSPEQAAEYQRMRSHLASDPEWHDGDIVWSRTF